MRRLDPQTGTGFPLRTGDTLTVVDPIGQPLGGVGRPAGPPRPEAPAPVVAPGFCPG